MSGEIVELPASGATPEKGTAVAESSSPFRSLSDIAKSGDMLATLESVRDNIVQDLDACESMRDKAALYLRLADVLKTIEELRPAVAKGDAVDEIAARRAARRAGPSAHPARAKNSV